MNIGYLLDYGKIIDSDINKLLISYLFSIKPIEVNFNRELLVDEDTFLRYKVLLDRIVNGEPIQYVINNTCFYGFDFFVDNRVLIPRRETEELVENSLLFINKYFKNGKVLDLCCGSGCIGITIKKINGNLDVSLVDISKDCIEVSKINANNLNVDVNCIESDLFNNVNDKYDVIISNPPYICDNEEIMDLVYNNEPHLALFGGIDGMDYYKRIHDEYLNYVNDSYLLAFEIGYDQGDKIRTLFSDIGCNIEIKKDLENNDRMAFIYKINE